MFEFKRKTKCSKVTLKTQQQCINISIIVLVYIVNIYIYLFIYYNGADKSLARPTSRCILFYGENISFDSSLVEYIYSTNIPPIMIINRIYENWNLLSL